MAKANAVSNFGTLENVVADFKRALECPICMDMVKQPFKLCATGHLMCVGCLNTIALCPTCQAALITENPVCIKQLLEYLPHDCQYSDNGCEVVFQNGNDHERFCEFRVVKCRFSSCNKDVLVKDLSQHYKKTHPHWHISQNRKENLYWEELDLEQEKNYNDLVVLFDNLFWFTVFNNVEDRQVEVRFEAIPIGQFDGNYYVNVSFANGSFGFRSTLKAHIPEEDKPSDQRDGSDRTGCMKVPHEMMSHLIEDGMLTAAEVSFFKD